MSSLPLRRRSAATPPSATRPWSGSITGSSSPNNSSLNNSSPRSRKVSMPPLPSQTHGSPARSVPIRVRDPMFDQPLPSNRVNWVVQTVTDRHKTANIGQLQTLWIKYDMNRDRNLDRREFWLFYNDYQAYNNQPATPEDFERLWHDLHPSEDTRGITWEEFTDLFSISVPHMAPIYPDDAGPMNSMRMGGRNASRVTSRHVDWLAKLGCSKDMQPSQKQLRELWVHYDKDKSRFLDKREFRSFYFDFQQLLGKVATEGGYEMFWREFDEDGNGRITWDEFAEIFGMSDVTEHPTRTITRTGGVAKIAARRVDWLAKLGCHKDSIPSRHKLQEAWRLYDKDRSGFLDKREFKVFYFDFQRMVGKTASEHGFEEFWNEFDEDGNGKIDWDEFCEIFSSDS